VYRREALKEAGGTAEIGHLEDVHTGFYAVYRRWRLKYIPIALACRISPDTAKAYFSQQVSRVSVAPPPWSLTRVFCF
jgi:cellulose synthase/poly-beta-1,6-N-acetylglucosamine synthase-like glycosyltransferase